MGISTIRTTAVTLNHKPKTPNPSPSSRTYGLRVISSFRRTGLCWLRMQHNCICPHELRTKVRLGGPIGEYVGGIRGPILLQGSNQNGLTQTHPNSLAYIQQVLKLPYVSFGTTNNLAGFCCLLDFP